MMFNSTFSSSPSLVVNFIILYGTHGTPSDSSPDSTIFFHSSFIKAGGVGVTGADISPPNSLRLRTRVRGVAIELYCVDTTFLSILFDHLAGISSWNTILLCKVLQIYWRRSRGCCCRSNRTLSLSHSTLLKSGEWDLEFVRFAWGVLSKYCHLRLCWYAQNDSSSVSTAMAVERLTL